MITEGAKLPLGNISRAVATTSAMTREAVKIKKLSKQRIFRPTSIHIVVSPLPISEQPFLVVVDSDTQQCERGQKLL